MSDTPINTRLSGEYRFEITSDDGTVRDTGWFPNLILNQGLNRLASTSGSFSRASVGTGTSIPVPTQTSLDSPVAYSTDAVFSSSTKGPAPAYSTLQVFYYTFAQGAVVGNMSEIGVGSAASGGNLFSRALIVDSAGNPTTITLTSIDQLTVYYRITIATPIVDGTGSVDLGGITYNFTTRVLGATSFANSQYLLPSSSSYFGLIYSVRTHAAGTVLAPITTDSLPSSGSSGTVGTYAYAANTFYRDWVVQWSPSQGNATGGIQGITLVSGGPYESVKFQVIFDRPIPKTNTNTLSLTFRFSWSR